MIDLTPLINAAILLVAALVGAYLVPWLKSRTSAEQRENLLKWVDIAVAAAQQLYHQCSGEVRLKYALELLQTQGFDVNNGVVQDAVEAAVLKLHQQLAGDDNDS